KRELCHFVAQKGTTTFPAIILPGKIAGTEVAIAPKLSTRWLGFFFDAKLTFRSHVKEMVARAELVVNGIGMLANTVRGLSQNHMRHIYMSCVLPVLTYG
ncbi:hypothetical protein IW261DRAFT_1316432, partial [Armillaria novae-zelandiae]